MGSTEGGAVDRRRFLKVAAGSAAALGGAGVLGADQSAPPRADGQAATYADTGVLTIARPGADAMLDVIKSLGFEYLTTNPGSSFRGLHESIINYGGNREPELLTCLHEEAAVAMAHGYFKIEGRPLAVLMYSSVGLQHAAMAVYSAFCDRVPVFMILGHVFDATDRSGRSDWAHAVQDPAVMVRDYTKWDDRPLSLGHFAESAARAYQIAMTPPMGPVALTVDKYLQERAAEDSGLRLPKPPRTAPPQGDHGAVAEAARLLVEAEFPVIVAERAARTPAGLRQLVELAELLQAAFLNHRDSIQRMNFPSRHPLNQSAGAIAQADVVLALECTQFWGVVNTMSMDESLQPTVRSRVRPGTKLISISSLDLSMGSNYQDFGRFQEMDLAIAADAEATLPRLIEEVRRLVTGNRRRAFEARGAQLAAAHQRGREQDRVRAAAAWDASPISPARIAAELWAQIRNRDWSLVSRSDGLSDWAQRLWDFQEYYHHIGQSGSVGIGYSAPAAVGAALANRKHGRLSINLQNDGDLMYQPGVLWTAAHHQIPMLTVMHNNRAYHAEVMHVQRMAGRHNRDITRCHIGTAIDRPAIDYAKLAQSMGWYAEGPITEPKQLAGAIRRAIAAVDRGEPALLDTVTQPR